MRLPIFLVLAFWAGLALAAPPSTNNVQVQRISEAVDTITLSSYTATAGSDRQVLVFNGTEHAADRTWDDCDMGATQMTEALMICNTGNDVCTSVWRLEESSIPGGANDIVCTFSLPVADAVLVALTLLGAGQTAPDTASTTGSNSTTISTTVNVTGTDSIIIDVGVSEDSGLFTGGSGQVDICDTGETGTDCANASGSRQVVVSEEDASGTGNHTQTQNGGNASSYSHIVTAWEAAAGAGGNAAQFKRRGR